MNPSTREITIDSEPRTVVVKNHDAVLAATKRAVLVHAERETPLYYMPREDVYFEQLSENGLLDRTDGRRARVWSVTGSGGGIENAAWQVEDATGPFEPLAGYIAFDPDLVSVMAD